LKGDNDRVETAEFICVAIQLYIARTRYGKSIENFIKTCLWDGNDVRLTRLLYQDNLRRIKQPRVDRWSRETVFELPPSGEEINKGLIAMREQMDDQSAYETRWLDAAIAFPKEYVRYVHERVLQERPEPRMTKEDVATVCMHRGRNRRHSKCTDNFRDGGRIICDDVAAGKIDYK
jgi:hypothetical protein